ncbi:hypothetical protein IWZ00DRAFT_501048 [Phyllosticta capitalensis]
MLRSHTNRKSAEFLMACSAAASARSLAMSSAASCMALLALSRVLEKLESTDFSRSSFLSGANISLIFEVFFVSALLSWSTAKVLKSFLVFGPTRSVAESDDWTGNNLTVIRLLVPSEEAVSKFCEIFMKSLNGTETSFPGDVAVRVR